MYLETHGYFGKIKGKGSYRYSYSKNEAIKYLAKSAESPTIPEIADHLKISVPTMTKVVVDLLNDGYILKDGKRIVENGRKPTQYRINEEKFYVVGVEILSKWIHVSVRKPNLELVYEELCREFVLDDDPHCLEFIETFISKTIKKSKVPKENIIGIGIGMIGDIKTTPQEPINYYKNLSDVLARQLASNLGLKVIIENDTRAIAITEQTIGAAKGYSNALVVKVSRKLGIAIILDGKHVAGADGLAGNLAHMQFGDCNKKRLCDCGKIGCLGTEIGGTALKNDLLDDQGKCKTSLNELGSIENCTYHQILEAGQQGDALSIKLIQAQGEKLGHALGNLINLLNPNLMVLGGEFVMVMDIFIEALKMGMRKTVLPDCLNNCEIKSTTLGRFLGSKAGACVMLRGLGMIEY